MRQSNASALPTGTVTFLFTDIEGSTRLIQDLGDGFPDVLAAHNRLIGEALNDFGGVLVRTAGDSFFAVFESPVDAVSAIAQAQRALAGHPWPDGAQIKVRAGIHTGVGVLGGDDYVGLDVHRAARIADTGHGGQVVVSDATSSIVERMLPDGITLRDLGKHRLKDLLVAETLFQVDIVGLPTDFPPLRTLNAVPNNLPEQLTSFVGRDEILAQALQLLTVSRVLTLTGPGGTGKTRLSMQVAAEAATDFPDGVFFVPLAPVEEPQLVAATILSSLGISLTSGDESPEQRLARELADRTALLVLDNFEQLLDAAPMVVRLAQSSLTCKVLVTSRAPLAIGGEQELPVPPLPTMAWDSIGDVSRLQGVASVQLFVERALGVRPDFELTADNAAAVARLVESLDGLPLAIELAASRLKLLTPEQILERLDARNLGWTRRDLPERQQTLWKAIDWSYDLLTESEREFFSRLSVFAGGARIDEIGKVCSAESETDLIDHLGSLVDHSLVIGFQHETGPRYRMLHVIREYASERLRASGEEEAVRRAHALAYLSLAEEAAPEMTGRRRRHWLDLLEVEHDNIRMALNWVVATGETDLAMRLGYACWRFWQARGHLHEAKAKITEVLAMPGGSPRWRAKALEASGGIDWWRGDTEACLVTYRTALEMQRRLGDPAEIANALYNTALAEEWDRAERGVGLDETKTVEHDEFDAMLDEAERIYTGLDDERGLGDIHWARAVNSLVYRRETSPEAIGHLEKSAELYRRAGNEFGLGWALFELALAYLRLEELDRAHRLTSEGLELFASHDDISAGVLFLMTMAAIARARGAMERAVTLAGAAHSLRLSSGSDLSIAGANEVILHDLEFETLEALTGALAESYREGRTMSFEEATSFALR